MKPLLNLFAIFFVFNLSSQNIPNTELKTLDGKTTNLQEIAQNNNLIIVSLWATWCAPCKNELDAINDEYDDWVEETGVKLFAISVDDSRTVKRVKPMVNGKGWEFEILLDTNSDLKKALGAPTVPVTLIIKNGKIVFRHSGYNPGAEDDLFEELKKYI